MVWTKEQIEAKLKAEASGEKSMLTADEGIDVSIEEIESFGNQASIKEMFQSIANYNRMLNEKITLINDSLTSVVPFTRENLYLFCAYTGSGKTSTAANITYPLWKQGKKTLVISNEESAQDILFRIACLETGLSFNAYKKGQMTIDDQKRCCILFPEIARYVKILDVGWKNGFTTKLEGVKAALEGVKDKDYSCILIDYFQLIKYSIMDPSKKTYDVLNDFRIFMGRFIKQSNCPIAIFAQLHSSEKRGGAKAIDARLKECPAIVEPATVIIEIAPNFENETTDFLIVKDRFGAAGKKIVCPFEKGRFLNQMDAKQLAERKLVKLQAQQQTPVAGTTGAEDEI